MEENCFANILTNILYVTLLTWVTIPAQTFTDNLNRDTTDSSNSATVYERTYL